MKKSKANGNTDWQFLDKDDVLLRIPKDSMGWSAEIWNPHEKCWEGYLGDDWDVFHNAGQISRKQAERMSNVKGHLDDPRVD